MKQLAGQPSLLLLLPSSQVSPAFTVPFPQSAGMVVLVVVDVLLDDEVLVVVGMLVEVLVELDVDVVVAPGALDDVVDEVDVDVVELDEVDDVVDEEVDVEVVVVEDVDVVDVVDVDVEVVLVVVVGNPAPQTRQSTSARPFRTTSLRPVSCAMLPKLTRSNGKRVHMRVVSDPLVTIAATQTSVTGAPAAMRSIGWSPSDFPTTFSRVPGLMVLTLTPVLPAGASLFTNFATESLLAAHPIVPSLVPVGIENVPLPGPSTP
jgi:hypothetical protein